MAQAQAFEGTIEEIAALLQGWAFAGRKARIIIEAEEDEEDLTDNLPVPLRASE